MVTEVSELQFSGSSSSRVLRLGDGHRGEQVGYQRHGMVNVTPSGMITEVSELHQPKADSPIILTPSGIQNITAASERRQPSKARNSIVVTPPRGSNTKLSDLQSHRRHVSR